MSVAGETHWESLGYSHLLGACSKGDAQLGVRAGGVGRGRGEEDGEGGVEEGGGATEVHGTVLSRVSSAIAQNKKFAHKGREPSPPSQDGGLPARPPRTPHAREPAPTAPCARRGRPAPESPTEADSAHEGRTTAATSVRKVTLDLRRPLFSHVDGLRNTARAPTTYRSRLCQTQAGPPPPAGSPLPPAPAAGHAASRGVAPPGARAMRAKPAARSPRATALGPLPTGPSATGSWPPAATRDLSLRSRDRRSVW